MTRGIISYNEIESLTLSLSDVLNEIENEIISKLENHYKITYFDSIVYMYTVSIALKNFNKVELEMLLDESIVSFADENHFKINDALKRLEKFGFLSLQVDLTDNTNLNPKIVIDENRVHEIITGTSIVDEIDFNDIFSISEYASVLFKNRHSSSISLNKFTKDFTYLLEKIDKNLTICKYLNRYTFVEQAMIIVLFSKKLREDTSMFDYTTGKMMDVFYDLNKDKMEFLRKVMDEDFKSVKDGVLKINQSSYISSNPSLELNEDKYFKFLDSNKKALKNFYSEELKYIKYKSLRQKLFLNEELNIQIQTIKKVSSPKEFKKVSKKLNKANFSSAIIGLFHGYPGTGKTACVYEIAKETKRDVLQVDISNIRDKYVGNSEKKLKQIFTDYKRAKKEMKRAPILLFNEADALIGQRTNTKDSVDVMNNSMQNILLEELENFDGILFATTNLIKNIDKAFDRRFLFKIKFKRPDKTIRKLIWEDKLPIIKKYLSKKILAYEITGGQIENIVRKIIINKTINNIKLSEYFLDNLCLEELSFRDETLEYYDDQLSNEELKAKWIL